MEKYNYFEAVKEDVKNYILEHDVRVTSSNKRRIAGVII